MSRDMTIEELVTIYPRLEAGESVIEPQDWPYCYHEDVTQLLAENAKLRRALTSIKNCANPSSNLCGICAGIIESALSEARKS